MDRKGSSMSESQHVNQRSLSRQSRRSSNTSSSSGLRLITPDSLSNVAQSHSSKSRIARKSSGSSIGSSEIKSDGNRDMQTTRITANVLEALQSAIEDDTDHIILSTKAPRKHAQSNTKSRKNHESVRVRTSRPPAIRSAWSESSSSNSLPSASSSSGITSAKSSSSSIHISDGKSSSSQEFNLSKKKTVISNQQPPNSGVLTTRKSPAPKRLLNSAWSASSSSGSAVSSNSNNLPGSSNASKDFPKSIKSADLSGFTDISSLISSRSSIKSSTRKPFRQRQSSKLQQSDSSLDFSADSIPFDRNQKYSLQPLLVSSRPPQKRYLHSRETDQTNIDFSYGKNGPFHNWAHILSTKESPIHGVTMSCNDLDDLPDELFSLMQLRRLDLSYNRMKAIEPLNKRFFQNLVSVDLKGNRLDNIPSEMASCHQLEYLNLYRNRITELPDIFGNMKHLRILDLGHNQLKSLPMSLYHGCVSLARLMLNSNQFKSVQPDIGLLTNLSKVLPDTVKQLSKLRWLDVSGNVISNLNGDMLNSWKQLAMLNIRQNNISELPVEIGSLENLMHIDIRKNNIEFLPPEISNLTYLTVIQMDLKEGQTTIRLPPPDICKSGIVKMMNYLRDVLHGGPEGSKCRIYGPGIEPEAQACDSLSFTIEAVDSFGRPSKTGGAEFSAVLNTSHEGDGENMNDKPLKVIDKQDGTYSVSYDASKSGSYQISVKIGTTNLEGSPYNVQIHPGSIDPKLCWSESQSLHKGTVAISEIFAINVCDRYGNRISKQLDPECVKFSAILDSNLPQESEEFDDDRISFEKRNKIRSAMNANLLNVAPELAGSISAQYNTLKSGVYSLMVKIDNQNIQGSPYQIAVEPEHASAAYSSVRAETWTSAISGERVTLDVLTRDSYGNPCIQGGNKIEAYLVHPGQRKESLKTFDKENGVYHINYCAPVPGKYQVEVKLLGTNHNEFEHIDGSPFDVIIFDSETSRDKHRNRIIQAKSEKFEKDYLQVDLDLAIHNIHTVKTRKDMMNTNLETSTLEIKPENESLFIQEIISSYDERRKAGPLPAHCIFMCCQYMVHCERNFPRMLVFLTKAIDHINDTIMEKQGLLSFTYWLANLLYLMGTLQDHNYFETGDIKGKLEKPTFLGGPSGPGKGSSKSAKFMGFRSSSQIDSSNQLLKNLDELLDNFSSCNIEHSITLQMFCQVFFFIDGVLMEHVLQSINRSMSQSQKVQVHQQSIRSITMNLGNLQRWAENNDLSPAVSKLARISQICSFSEEFPVRLLKRLPQLAFKSKSSTWSISTKTNASNHEASSSMSSNVLEELSSLILQTTTSLNLNCITSLLTVMHDNLSKESIQRLLDVVSKRKMHPGQASEETDFHPLVFPNVIHEPIRLPRNARIPFTKRIPLRIIAIRPT